MLLRLPYVFEIHLFFWFCYFHFQPLSRNNDLQKEKMDTVRIESLEIFFLRINTLKIYRYRIGNFVSIKYIDMESINNSSDYKGYVNYIWYVDTFEFVHVSLAGVTWAWPWGRSTIFCWPRFRRKCRLIDWCMAGRGNGGRMGMRASTIGFRTLTLVLCRPSLPNLVKWYPYARGRTLLVLGSVGQRSRSLLL